MITMSHRRLAHLLAVPVRPHNFRRPRCVCQRGPMASMACTARQAVVGFNVGFLGNADVADHTTGASMSLSLCSPVVVCPRKCVCWPDGDFTDSEQGVLDTVYDFMSDNMHKSSYLWVIYLTRFLSTHMAFMSRRCLAHLLSVPVRTDLVYGQTLVYCVVARVTKNSVGKALWEEATRLLLQLPLCPNVGAVFKSGWQKHDSSMRHRHPGRCQIWTSTLSLVHVIHRADFSFRSQYARLVLTLGAYPMCGCIICKWSGEQVSPNVTQWRRWHARPAKQTWVSVLVSI
jgi:hypothetical protein